MSLSICLATFYPENVNLLINPNVNRQNGVAYKKHAELVVLTSIVWATMLLDVWRQGVSLFALFIVDTV